MSFENNEPISQNDKDKDSPPQTIKPISEEPEISEEQRRAARPTISTPDEDKALVHLLLEQMGLKQMQEQINQGQIQIAQISQALNRINESLTQIVPVIDQHTQILNNFSNPQQTGGGINDQEQKIMMVGDLLEKAASAWSKFKGNDNQPIGIPGLNPQDLMAEAAEAVRDDFSIGKELRGAIKSSIRKKAVGNIVKEVLRPEHAPE